jgi:hypothetical protein
MKGLGVGWGGDRVTKRCYGIVIRVEKVLMGDGDGVDM